MEEHGSIKLNHITLINYLESMGSLYEFIFHKIQRKQGIKSMQIYSWKHMECIKWLPRGLLSSVLVIIIKFN